MSLLYIYLLSYIIYLYLSCYFNFHWHSLNLFHLSAYLARVNTCQGVGRGAGKFGKRKGLELVGIM